MELTVCSFHYSECIMNNRTSSSDRQGDGLERAEAEPGHEEHAKESQGVQSLETGVDIVFALSDFPGPVGLGELARKVGLSRSKTHRYLVSLCRSGLVTQDPGSGHYDLGVAAVRLGLAAQGRIDEYRLADEVIDELQDRTGFSSSVVVWGNHGPTIVRRKESSNAVTVNTRVGSVLPITTSASGRVFAAYLPRTVAEPLVEAEFNAGLRPRHLGEYIDRLGFEELLKEIRAEGIARVSGDLLVGVDALAAPLFGIGGGIAMVVTLVAPTGAIDIRPGGRNSQVMKTLCTQFSERLGNTRATLSGGAALPR